MPPPVKYTKTADGLTIAYSAMGDGPPVVLMPASWSHLGLIWDDPQARLWLERVGRGRKLVLYDGRGTGLSQRDVAAYSLDTLILDLEAVLDATGVDRVDLYAVTFQCAAAIEFAARCPERVAHLLLVGAFARGADFWGLPRVRAVRAIRETDWELYAESFLKVVTGPDAKLTEGEVRAHARLILEGTSAESLRAFMEASEAFDVSDRLPLVSCPALVMSIQRAAFINVSLVQEIASRIPNAELVLLDDSASFLRYSEEVADAIGRFLGVEGVMASQRDGVSAFRTVLFTDLAGHTEMMSRLGDEGGRAVLREHERITREVLKAHGGAEVKTMGDGFMASFGSVTRAVECAVALQRAMEAWNAEEVAQQAGRLRVRVGLNAGEPIEEEGDLYGATVILASRIAARAEGGEILVSDNVRSLCAGKGFEFADRGEFKAKGFVEPVRVYAVKWSA